MERTMTATTATLVIRALLPVFRGVGGPGAPRQSIYGQLPMPQLQHNHGGPKTKPMRKTLPTKPNLALGRDTIPFFFFFLDFASFFKGDA